MENGDKNAGGSEVGENKSVEVEVVEERVVEGSNGLKDDAEDEVFKEAIKTQENLQQQGIKKDLVDAAAVGAQLYIHYPGNEVPKWFSYTSNHPTTIQPLPEYEWDEYDRKERYVGGSEFRFEIPLKLQVGETLLGLALSFVLEPSTYYSDSVEYLDAVKYYFNGKKTFEPRLYYDCYKAAHVGLALVGLGEQDQQGDICQVVFRFRNGFPIESCGVHYLTSSLGKRPRPRGSSDVVDDEDDHPKRRQIDPNVPIDIKEDEEQEQPSASDDPQFLIY